MSQMLFNRIQLLPEPVELCMVLRVIAQQGKYSSIQSIAATLGIKPDFVKKVLIEANQKGYVTNDKGALMLHIPEPPAAPQGDNSPIPDEYIKAAERLREWALIKVEHKAEPVQLGMAQWAARNVINNYSITVNTTNGWSEKDSRELEATIKRISMAQIREQATRPGGLIQPRH